MVSFFFLAIISACGIPCYLAVLGLIIVPGSSNSAGWSLINFAVFFLSTDSVIGNISSSRLVAPGSLTSVHIPPYIHACTVNS